MQYNPDIHHRHSIRLRDYDYSQAGAYFITICTQGKECLFGKEIISTNNVGADPCVCPGTNEIFLTEAGRMVQDIWHEIPNYYPNIGIDAFVVMPNHVHGIVLISEPKQSESKGQTRGFVGLGQTQGSVELGQTRGSAPTDINLLSLSKIIQRYKSLTTKRYIDAVKQQGWPPFSGMLWQRNYWEHVIRNETELHRIREYMQQNPARWEMDALYNLP